MGLLKNFLLRTLSSKLLALFMIYDVQLRQFRSYGDESFEFNPAVTIIVGPNASGKTNLLEAILVLARGKSYRAGDMDLIQFAKPWARLEAKTDSGERVLKLTPEEPVKKSYEINGQTYKRLTSRHSLPVVLFEPDHLRMLSGSPERRRAYLDELLSQVSPAYGSDLRRYKKALAQRNALLKLGETKARQQIFPWNVRLSQLAGSLVRERLELVDKLSERLGGLYEALSKSQTDLQIAYMSACQLDNYESSLLSKLESQLELDLARGFTGSGPHRDDLQLTFDGQPLTLSASRGETRTAVLAMKIIELQIIEEALEIRPILLLDDVFSELDGARRRALTDYLKNYQTFITTTDADLAVESFADNCGIIPLGGGRA